MTLDDYSFDDLVAVTGGGMVTEKRWLVGQIVPGHKIRQPLKTHLLRTNTASMVIPVCGSGISVPDPKSTTDPLQHVDCQQCLKRMDTP